MSATPAIDSMRSALKLSATAEAQSNKASTPPSGS